MFTPQPAPRRISTRTVLRAACDVVLSAVDCVASTAGPILATIACCLIAFVTVEYFVDLLPRMAASRGWLYAQAMTVLGLWLLGNLAFNYGAAMLVSPGEPPAELTPAQRTALLADPELEPGNAYRFCAKCSKAKPMRAHHCSVCRRCVLKMDHHCPWINNCVGYRNHKYFLLFLFYLWAGCLFLLLCDWDLTVTCILGGTLRLPFRLVLAVVLAFSALIATSLFQLWSFYLAFTNQTTIEFYGRRFPNAPRGFKGNPYDLGIARNLKEVFGQDATVLTWCLPSRAPPPGDGVTFPLAFRYTASQLPDDSWASEDRPDLVLL